VSNDGFGHRENKKILEQSRIANVRNENHGPQPGKVNWSSSAKLQNEHMVLSFKAKIK